MIFVKPNYYNAHVLKFEETHRHNNDPLRRASQDGYIPSLMHTVKPTYMDKPARYNKSNIEAIQNKYSKIAKDINKNRNQSLNDSQTLLYLSESFINPELLPDLLLNESPIPYISSMVNDNIGGTMYSQFIGGGTANLEWSVLTSFSLEVFNEPLSVTPYSDFYANSQNHNTVLNFYRKNKVAIHPFTANLYNRTTVFDEIGFNDFRYLDHGIKHTDKLGRHLRVADEALNKDILEVTKQKNVGLIHILSMQNHSPYTRSIPNMAYKPEINTKVYPKNRERELINYLQGIHASDKAIQELIQELDKSDKDVNLLFYGDHFPSVFTGMENQFKGDSLHKTPWFIYMNKDRSQKGIQLDGISPSFFIPVLLKEGNYYVSPFQGLLDTLLSHGVKRVGNNYVVTQDGKLYDEALSKDLSMLVQDYRTVEYDALFGSNWLGSDFYTKFVK